MTATSPGRLAALWPGMRQKMVGGTSVVLGTVLIANMLRIVSSMILTRLLDAEAFGITAITTSVAFVIVMVSDLGFYSFIMRHADSRNPRFLDEIWTIRLIRSFGLVAVFMLLAKPVAYYVGDPRLEAVFWVSSFSFLVESFASLASITAVQDGLLRRLSLFELLTAIILLVCNVLLSLWLRSYWALLLGPLIAGFIKVAMSYGMFGAIVRRRFAWNLARMKELWGFSRYIAASSAITLLLSQSDKLVLARALTLDSFGKYAIAMGLVGILPVMASSYVQKILYPAYVAAGAEGRGDAGIATTFYGKKRLIGALYAFAVGGIIGAAHLAVAILYDERYASVATFIQILAISALLRFNTMAAEEALIASGRPKVTLTANIARLAWVIALAGAAVLAGRPELVVAVAGTIEVPATIFYSWMLQRYGIFRLREELVWVAAAAVGVALGWLGATVLIPFV